MKHVLMTVTIAVEVPDEVDHDDLILYMDRRDIGLGLRATGPIHGATVLSYETIDTELAEGGES